VRTAFEAVRDYTEAVQRVVACFASRTVAVEVKGGYFPADDPHALTVNRGLPLPIRGNGRLGVAIRQAYRIVQDPRSPHSFRISTAEYIYELDVDGKEVLGFHWHPETTPDIVTPHLHVRAGSTGEHDAALLSPRAHIPTGRVAIEDVFRFLVREYHAQPARADWATILDETQATFEQLQTWTGTRGRPR